MKHPIELHSGTVCYGLFPSACLGTMGSAPARINQTGTVSEAEPETFPWLVSMIISFIVIFAVQDRITASHVRADDGGGL